MKPETISKVFLYRLFLSVLIIPVSVVLKEVQAQAVTANPLEWAVLIEGNELTDAQIGSGTSGKVRSAALQGTMAAEFTQIRRWEAKYNSYLKSAEGYASSLKAATQLYSDGLRLLMCLGDLRRAVADNPEGIAATLGMNSLYMEAATELVSVFSTLQNAVAAGGASSMLTGAERSSLLWTVEDRLKALNRKLSQLALSLKYYTMTDLWNSLSSGAVDRSYGDIARQARSRWIRAARVH